MNPYVLLAAAALVGAYYLGSRVQDSRALPQPGPAPVPLPPAEAEVPTSPEGAINLALWADTPFEVDVFPATASRQQLPPPDTELGVTVADDCTAIAVGHGWWEVMGIAAQSGVAQGLSNAQIIALIRADMPVELGTCVDEASVAGVAFVAELDQRISMIRALADVQQVYLQLPKTGGGGGGWQPWTPHKNPGCIGPTTAPPTGNRLLDFLWGRR